MLRRLSGLCLSIFLILSAVPIDSVPTAYAQDGSPVAVDPSPAEPDPSVSPTSESDVAPVQAAEDFNTPAGIPSTTPVFALDPSVYLYFNQVTASGNSTAEERSTSVLGSFLDGYRTDNARVFAIATTATYKPNITVCIYYGPGQFVNPAAANLFRLDGGAWVIVTGSRDSGTVCGYTAVLGTFVVAEPGVNPTVASTNTPTPSPTDTSVPTATDTTVPTATKTATSTETTIPADTATVTASSTPTLSDSPTSSAAPTETASSTSTRTATPAATETATPSHTPEPTETATSSATTSPSSTSTATDTSTPSSTPTAIPTSTQTPTFTATPTSATGQTQYALPNVWVNYAVQPTSGTTWGSETVGSTLPPLPPQYRVANAWFFSIESDVIPVSNKQVCVLFDSTRYVNPASLTLLRSTGSSWTLLTGQVFPDIDAAQGTVCGYTTLLGAFALAEHPPATATSTATASRTATATATPSNTATTGPTWTPTPSKTPISSVTPSSTSTSVATSTPTPTPTGTATATSTSTPTSTPTSTQSPTRTPTLGPGSYPTGTTLRATTRVNLRTGPSSGTSSKGVLATGISVQVTGPSTTAGGHSWVPVSVSGLGSGWVAGEYLKPVPSPTPTRTPASSTATRTPGGSIATRTPTRPPGGFIAGDSVKTTTRLNLRSSPGTGSQVLTVLPTNSFGQITGSGISSGGVVFYPVLFDGRPSGYVAGNYLQRVAATPTPTRTLVPTATIAGVPTRWTTSSVNMRSGAGTGYRIVMTLPKGTRLTVTGNPKRSGGYDWYPVVAVGIGPGWVAGKFLTAIQPV